MVNLNGQGLVQPPAVRSFAVARTNKFENQPSYEKMCQSCHQSFSTINGI